ncbi:hypothetical protein GCM10028803_03290 [Larkinella knui]|uniref:DUF4199 domain-containing protein n=1 Tax=Larkinella knui TaxID=2025310 RepID=A0A3P1CL56_9BACT|nr:DUF4199 domain-containing protein [Larkinella knui]RRB13979.1 DUF4199 domain-containing protein [Larkinella knui]
MEEKPSTARLALKWGLISGVIFMVYTTVINLTGQFSNTALPWLSLLISIVLIVMAMREFRTLNGGFMSFGEGVSLGTLLSVISGLISITYNLIYTTFIDPTIRQQMLDNAREQMENRGMADEQIEQAMEFTEKIQSPGLQFLVGILFAAIFGVLISLIAAAFIRRNKPPFSDFQN